MMTNALPKSATPMMRNIGTDLSPVETGSKSAGGAFVELEKAALSGSGVEEAGAALTEVMT